MLCNIMQIRGMVSSPEDCEYAMTKAYHYVVTTEKLSRPGVKSEPNQRAAYYMQYQVMWIHFTLLLDNFTIITTVPRIYIW